MSDFELAYDASPTCANFINSRAPRKILAGPVGGGKTSGCIIATLLNAMQQEPDNDGFRRSRHVIIRNTIAQLKQTTQKTLLDWLPEGVFGRFLTTDRTYYLEFEDVRAEIILLALEDEADIRRLLSLEATTIYINELKEVSQAVIEGIIGTKRIGRYPSRKSGPGATYPCLIADTNMPAVDTFHHRIMEKIEGDWETFKQPGGRTPEAENLRFLPEGYYSTDGLSEEYVRVFIDCEYGTSKEGLPVFKNTFIRDFHVAKSPLKHILSPDYPLLIGLDAGLTPAAIIGQLLPSGKLNILGECYTPRGESIGMERFLTSRLGPMLRTRYQGAPVMIIVDPAATQQAQTDEETVYKVIKKAGYNVRTAASNKLDLRIGSAESLFGRQVGGQAVVQIDAGAEGLIKALSFGYRFAPRKDGEVDEKPRKEHPESDIGDAFCYLTSYVVGATGVRKVGRREIKQVDSRGWT